MKTKAFALALIGLATLAWSANSYVNNNVDVSDTSATITIDASGKGYKTLKVIIDGENVVAVCPWRLGEKPSACVFSDTGGVKLKTGESQVWYVSAPSPSTDGKGDLYGFVAVSVVCGTGLTSLDNRVEAFDPF